MKLDPRLNAQRYVPLFDVAAVGHPLERPLVGERSDAIAERDQKIQFAAISKLPDMRRQLKALQQAVDELTRAAAASSSQHAA